MFYLRTKFDDSSFSQCTDIIRAFWGSQNFKCVHVTVITPLLWAICPSYDGNLYSLHVYTRFDHFSKLPPNSLGVKCMPILLYGLDTCPVSPRQLRSFNHVVVSCGCAVSKYVWSLRLRRGCGHAQRQIR